MPDEPTRYVVYARQSISRYEEDSLSIQMQVKACSEYIASKGGRIVGVFEEPNTRGWRTDRPQFNAMLEHFRNGTADIAIVFKLSRFARNLVHQETVLNEIAEAGGDLVSVTEPYLNTSPMVRQILGAVNEQNRRDQSDFLRASFASRTRHGKHHGRPPLGYVGTESGQLAIDEDGAEAIRLMFRWALEGHGSSEIAMRLNDRQLWTGTGNQWDESSVLRSLRRPTYAGHVVYGGEVVAHNAHPAIIPPETFDDVQRILAARSRVRRKTEQSWSDGFIWHACGSRMHAAGWKDRDGSQRWRYRCTRALNSRGKVKRGPVCRHQPGSIFCDRAEEAILAQLIPALSDLLTPAEAAERIEASRDTSQRERDRDRARLDRRIDDVSRQRDRLLTLTLAGRVDDEMYAMRDAALKDDLARLRAERDAIPDDVPVASLEARHGVVLELADAVPIVVNRAPERLPELLHALDARLVVGDGDPSLRFGPETAVFVRGS